ncbi:Rrf2 family transcriptional regulator [candidate division KSB1 bacterium]|nr:Rrf2 family transcriptional regulator [Candidatus Aminicenantes bacterium]RQW03600.1 MAG: Rrf2 family transcriptional regulator [candidate division KSB1 bacterium]
MKINTKIRYGLRMVIAIAQADKLVNTTELGNGMDVSPKYLRKLAGPLEKAGLIKSVQGIYGGYELNKNPEEITIRMIFNAYHEQLSWTDCVLGKKCKLRDSCQAKQVWEMLEKTLQMHFLPISIRDILNNKVL